MYLGRYVLDIFHLCKLGQKSGHLKKVADHAQFVYDRAIIFFYRESISRPINFFVLLADFTDLFQGGIAF